MWHEFLNSLATRGGNIFLLVLICLGLGCLVLHVLHHPQESQQTIAVILTTFSTFTGALMNALTGGTGKQRSGDNGNGRTPEEKKP